MSNVQHPDADFEALSALFDGELRVDAARFALKRLDHDTHWSDICGRWQLAGDALRGQVMAVAPAGFADRVGAALADENAAAASTGGVASHTRATARGAPNRRRWIGGVAMAASVAAAALFVSRPLPESNAPPTPAPQVVASGQPATPATGRTDTIARQDLAPASAGQVSTPQTTRLPAAEIGFAAAVATADTPRRAVERPSQGQVRPAEPEPSQPRIDRAITVAAAPAAIASHADAMPAVIEPSSTHPFLPQGEIASRPWPRAALPDYPTGRAFTASFDSNAAPVASSFYPFEPRMLGADRPQQPAPDPSEWPQR